MLEDSYDKNKVIECMFDPTTSEILAELENGGKESIHLAKISKISEEEVRERLSYLLEHKFILEKKENEKIIYSADTNKLAEVMEKEGNFDSAMDGLAKMDSYLN
ncbi:MAG: Exonuclease SbcC [Nitrosopumilales archaeon]|nr:MAG: Exonuclease SbcC [Nitrosopumilales archaeon]